MRRARRLDGNARNIFVLEAYSLATISKSEKGPFESPKKRSRFAPNVLFGSSEPSLAGASFSLTDLVA